MIRFRMLRNQRALLAATMAMFSSLLASTSARAEAGCPVQVGPIPVDSAWTNAGRDLERQLRTTHDGQTCGSIELLVENDAAHLTLDTRDGRRAIRELSQPFELAPTVLALLVTLEPQPGQEPAPPEKAPAPADSVTVAEPRATPAVAESRAFGVFGASLGARAGGGFGTPVIAGYGLVRAGNWELGAIGQWEASYRKAGEDNPEWRAVGLSAGVLIGRRHPLSASLDLLLGASIAGVVLRQGHSGVRDGQVRFDGRLGGYFGAVWPTQSSFRMRTLLGADVVAIGGSQSTRAPDVPSLPNWAATVSLGVESGGPF